MYLEHVSRFRLWWECTCGPSHTQCASRPYCVTVMRILSAKLTVLAVVSMRWIVEEAVCVRAGYGAGVTM
jgi:hypothetical protein